MSFWSFELMRPIIESLIIHLVPCHCVHKTLSFRARKSCKQIPSNFLAVQCERLSRLRKQPAFRDFSTGFPTKWRLRNVRRNSILMTCHYTELGTAFDWLKQVSVAARSIRSTNLIWVVADTSSEWNFYARSSDVISRGNQWWHREISSFFLG